MENQFINLTLDNIDQQHICCIIRKSSHPGIDHKKEWLKQQLPLGHVFRKLDVEGTVFIEYAPLENAWVPIIGDNYLYIYCLWILAPYKHQGYGKQLMQYCIDDAKAQGKSGICMLGSEKQINWLSDQAFAKRFGFEVCDKTDDGYHLLALSFDKSVPRFAERAKKQRIEQQQLTIFYSPQCPFVVQRIEKIQQYCAQQNIPVSCEEITSLKQAKDLPGIMNNWAVFYKGKHVTVNQIDGKMIERILKKYE